MSNWRKASDGWEANLTDLTLTKNMVYLPATSTIDFKMFREYRGSGYDVLYWQFTRVGPGVHKTTYTIWNK